MLSFLISFHFPSICVCNCNFVSVMLANAPIFTSVRDLWIENLLWKTHLVEQIKKKNWPKMCIYSPLRFYWNSQSIGREMYYNHLMKSFLCTTTIATEFWKYYFEKKGVYINFIVCCSISIFLSVCLFLFFILSLTRKIIMFYKRFSFINCKVSVFNVHISFSSLYLIFCILLSM